MEFGEDGDARSDAFDDGAADENHFERIFFRVQGPKKTSLASLAAVPLRRMVMSSKAREGWGDFDVGGEEDGAGAGAENGAALAANWQIASKRPSS